MWKLPNDQLIWRTTKKIKAGEELTYCYASIPFGLKNRAFRQKFIKGEIHDRKPGHENFYCHLAEDHVID